MSLIYQDSGKSIFLDQEAEYGNGEDQPPTLPRIERYVYVGTEDPDPAELVINVEDGDPVSQRILDKLQDLSDLADAIEASPPADTSNIVSQFQSLKNELPDIIRAVLWLSRNQIRSR